MPYPTEGKKYYRLPDRENHAQTADAREIKHLLNAVTDTHPSKTDPLGMYTGMPADPYDTPVQDVDDL